MMNDLSRDFSATTSSQTSSDGLDFMGAKEPRYPKGAKQSAAVEPSLMGPKTAPVRPSTTEDLQFLSPDADLKDALASSPNSTSAPAKPHGGGHSLKAEILLDALQDGQRDWERSRNILLRRLALNPDDADVQAALADLDAARLADLDAARFGSSLEKQAFILWKTNDLAKAEQAYRNLYKKTRNPRFKAMEARVLMEKGDTKAAIRKLLEAKKLAPDDPFFLLLLAEAEAKDGNRAAAAKTLEKYLTHDPNNRAAREMYVALTATADATPESKAGATPVSKEGTQHPPIASFDWSKPSPTLVPAGPKTGAAGAGGGKQNAINQLTGIRGGISGGTPNPGQMDSGVRSGEGLPLGTLGSGFGKKGSMLKNLPRELRTKEIEQLVLKQGTLQQDLHLLESKEAKLKEQGKKPTPELRGQIQETRTKLEDNETKLKTEINKRVVIKMRNSKSDPQGGVLTKPSKDAGTTSPAPQ